MKTRWSYRRAMKNLDVKRIRFDPDQKGTSRAYSLGRSLAISPDEKHPEFGVIHELAHIVLEHTTGQNASSWAMYKYHMDPRPQETEAHAVALTVAAVLEFEDRVDYDLDDELHYLQHFSRGIKLPPIDKVRAAAKIIVAAGIKE